MDHFRSSSRTSLKDVGTPTDVISSPPNSPSTKSTKDSEVPNNIDIVDLLKDICGSVHDLKTEMGQNGLRDVSKFDLLHAEDGNHHNIRIAEMSGIKQLDFNIWKLRNIHYMFWKYDS